MRSLEKISTKRKLPEGDVKERTPPRTGVPSGKPLKRNVRRKVVKGKRAAEKYVT